MSDSDNYTKFTFDNGFNIEVRSRQKTARIDQKAQGTSENRAEIRNRLPIAATAPPPVVPRHGHAPVVAPIIQQRDHRPNQSHSNAHQERNQTETMQPPPVTEEDWKIFRQFMDPFPKKREMFQCSICNLSVDAELESVRLGCGHQFCRLCLTDEIETRFNYQGQVKCPMRQLKCPRYMEDDEVQKILVEKFPNFIRKVMKMLQEEAEKVKQEKHLADEKEIEKMVFVKNKEEFECQICLCEAAPGDGVIIKSCRHSFCKECLTNHIKYSEDIEIKCPFNGNDGNCDKIITEREMRGFAPVEILEKHIQKSLTLFETTSKTFHCMRPDCTGFVEIEDDNVRGFMCHICSEVNCIRCKAIHANKTCDEYEDIINPDGRRKKLNDKADQEFKAYIEAGKAMYCPQCRIAIVKEIGCDYITCPICKLGICWVTKKPRMPLKRSDGVFIDGCHCRETGPEIRCHPDCMFCR